MRTTTIIQIMVFALAGVIVLVFIITGVHFVRAIIENIVNGNSIREAIQHQTGPPTPEIVLVELREKDGVMILQPDGLEDLALRVESEDERRIIAAALKYHETLRLAAIEAEKASAANRSSPQETPCLHCGRFQTEIFQENQNIDRNPACSHSNAPEGINSMRESSGNGGQENQSSEGEVQIPRESEDLQNEMPQRNEGEQTSQNTDIESGSQTQRPLSYTKRFVRWFSSTNSSFD